MPVYFWNIQAYSLKVPRIIPVISYSPFQNYNFLILGILTVNIRGILSALDSIFMECLPIILCFL